MGVVLASVRSMELILRLRQPLVLGVFASHNVCEAIKSLPTMWSADHRVQNIANFVRCAVFVSIEVTMVHIV